MTFRSRITRSRITQRLAAEAQTRVRPLLGETFTLDGQTYPYFFHRKNATWLTERIVELAVAQKLYDPTARTLEIGNVMQQYFAGGHTIVDRYERGAGVTNEDALTFQAEPFDAILSISTIEHIGWDETPRDPTKLPKAIDNLRGLLKPGGTLMVTLPHGYNCDLDDLLQNGALPFDRVSYLARDTGLTNRWRQVQRDEIVGYRYGFPWPAANAIAVATLSGK